MLYAVMNLGGWLPTFVSPPLRQAYGIAGEPREILAPTIDAWRKLSAGAIAR